PWSPFDEGATEVQDASGGATPGGWNPFQAKGATEITSTPRPQGQQQAPGSAPSSTPATDQARSDFERLFPNQQPVIPPPTFMERYGKYLRSGDEYIKRVGQMAPPFRQMGQDRRPNFSNLVPRSEAPADPSLFYGATILNKGIDAAQQMAGGIGDVLSQPAPPWMARIGQGLNTSLD